METVQVLNLNRRLISGLKNEMLIWRL